MINIDITRVFHPGEEHSEHIVIPRGVGGVFHVKLELVEQTATNWEVAVDSQLIAIVSVNVRGSSGDGWSSEEDTGGYVQAYTVGSPYAPIVGLAYPPAGPIEVEIPFPVPPPHPEQPSVFEDDIEVPYSGELVLYADTGPAEPTVGGWSVKCRVTIEQLS